MSERRFGRYLLHRRLGAGGMAEVWKAEVTGPQGFSRAVVIKRLLSELVSDPSFVEMFLAEARLSARLHHANIVQIHELGDVDGEPFIAMEYIDGCNLASLMTQLAAERRPMPLGQAVFVASEVTRALAYAHQLADDGGARLDIIHRDISPSNVMLGRDGSVRLVDFGIAKALAVASDHQTATGVLKGKLGYLAPEKLQAGGEVDHRSDQFAVGVVLHEMLTGRRLFKGTSDLHTLEKIERGQVRPPSEHRRDVPPELDLICLRALATRPAERYPSCQEMGTSLDDLVHRLRWSARDSAELLASLPPLAAQPEKAADDSATRRATPSARTADRDDKPRSRWPLGVGVGMIAGIAAVAIALRPHHWQPSSTVAPSSAAVVAPSPVAVAPPQPVVVVVAPSPTAVVAPHASAVAAPTRRPGKRAPRPRKEDLHGGAVVDPFEE